LQYSIQAITVTITITKMADSNVTLTTGIPAADKPLNRRLRKQQLLRERKAVEIAARASVPLQVTCRMCKVALPDIIPEKYRTYICTPCAKMEQYHSYLSKLVQSGDDKADADKLMDKIDAMFDDTVVYPQYIARVTYDRSNSRHCGYCSDSYDIKVTETPNAITVDLPLFRSFKNADINRRNLITDFKKLCEYYGVGITYQCCRNGQTSYSIDSVEVVNRQPRITLDD
jgi:hypothetical protein